MIRALLTIFCVSLFWLNPIQAQQIADFSTFRENAIAHNPALTGEERASYGYIVARSQWSDIKKSPFTANIGFHTRLDRKNIGIGGYIFSDFTGPSSYTAINGSFAYHIVFSEYRRGVSEYRALSFGLGLSIVQHRLNANQIILDQPMDNSISQNKGTQLFPDASFGLQYKTKKFFVGASIPQLLHLNVEIEGQGNNVNRFRKMQHYFLMLGGRIYAKKTKDNHHPFYVEPALNVHYVINAPFQGVGSIRFAMEDLFHVGIGYRSASTLVFEGGFTVSKRFRLFYAYDFAVGNSIRNATGQVHEIGMGFKFNRDIFSY